MSARYLLTDATPEAPRPPEPARLLWGWPEVIRATGIPRRTLERELSARRFPQPARRVGRRPYWKPEAVTAWTQGGES